MSELDPTRYRRVVLVDPTHVLTVPNRPTPFSAEGEVVDTHDPYWIMLLADKSVRLAPDES